MTGTEAKKIANKLRKALDDVTLTNAKNDKIDHSFKGARVSAHAQAKTLELQLFAVVGGFERIAENSKKKRR
jgi:hypothetical protein